MTPGNGGSMTWRRKHPWLVEVLAITETAFGVVAGLVAIAVWFALGRPS